MEYYLERSDGKRIAIKVNSGKRLLAIPADGADPVLDPPALVPLDATLADIAGNIDPGEGEVVGNTVAVTGPALGWTTDGKMVALPDGFTAPADNDQWTSDYIAVSVAAADIIDATATGQALITAEDEEAIRDISGTESTAELDARDALQSDNFRGAATLFKKLTNMRLEPLDHDQNGLAPAADTKQLIWLNVGDSIAARAFDPVMQVLLNTYSPDIPYYRNGRGVTVVAGATTYSGHISPINQFATTTGTINEKNSATADYAGSPTGSTIDLDATETLSFFGKPGHYTGPGAFDTPVLVPATLVKIFYERSNGAGTFDIEVSSTATDSGFTKQGDTIAADNATTEIAVAERALALGDYAGRIVAQSGSVKILGWALYRDDIPQVVIYNAAVGSLSPLEWGTPSSAQIEGLMAALAPDFITWAYNDSSADNEVGVDVLDAALAAVSLAPTKLGFSNVSTVSTDSMVDSRFDMFRDAGWIVYSARYALGSDDEIIAAGLEGDGIHLEDRAYQWMADDMMRGLGIPGVLHTLHEQPKYEDGGRSIETTVQNERSWISADGNLLARFKPGESFVAGISEPLALKLGYSGLQMNIGDDNDKIELPELWSDSSSFTVMIRADIFDSETNQAGRLFSWSNAAGSDISSAASSNGGFDLQLRPSVQAPSGRVGLRMNLNSGDGSTGGRVSEMDIGEAVRGPRWIAVRYDHSTGDVDWFLDGVKNPQGGVDPGEIVDWNANTLAKARIFNDTTNNGGIREVSGRLYQFAIYDTAHTDADILSLYQRPELAATLSNAKAVYTIDERKGSRLFDASGSGNHAAITGANWQWLNPLGAAAFGGSASATLDYASIAADASEALTITVTGAAIGDTVILQPQQIGGVSLYGHVSAADTVTVTAINHSAGAIDPASTSVRATVVKN